MLHLIYIKMLAATGKFALFFLIIFAFILTLQNRTLISSFKPEFNKGEIHYIPTQQATTSEPEVKESAESAPIHHETKNFAHPTQVETKTDYSPITIGQSDTDESYQPETSPCDKPIGFKIGNYDSRFTISKESFTATVQSAANLWNNALGKTILYYNPEGKLTVNLTYDDRQAKTDERNFLALDIENAKQNADMLKKQFENEKAVYEKDTSTFNASVATFEERKLAYETKVDTYNKQGGAPQSEYDQTMLELANLKEEAAKLDTARASLLTQMKSINDKVARYNEFVKYINSLVTKINALGGYKFTEGRFIPSTETIDIYQYDNNNKLFRVVAHELGHALGIGHTKNQRSIMFSVNTGTTTSLSKEDIQALTAICLSN